MVGEDRVIMSVKELRRVPAIRHALEQKMTHVQAGALFGADNAAGPAAHRAGRAGGRPGAGASGRGAAVEPADAGAGQGHGADAVYAALWGLWADAGGREAGRAAGDHAQ